MIHVKGHRRGQSVIKAYIRSSRADFDTKYGSPANIRARKAQRTAALDFHDKVDVTRSFLRRRGMMDHRGGSSTRSAHDVSQLGRIHARHVGPRSTHKMKRRRR